MIAAARGPWTEKQILDALHAASGSTQIKFRFDVLKNGVRVRSVPAGGEVTLNRFANIQRTARFDFYEQLDWLHDEIKPYMLLRMDDAIVEQSITLLTWRERDAQNLTWKEFDALEKTWGELDSGVFLNSLRVPQFAEFPLGVFVLSTPSRTSKDGINTWSVEAYDHTIILEEDCISEPLFFPKGTPYMEAISDILNSAGVTQVFMQATTDTLLPSDRIFEVGTSKRVIINRLLSEITFNSIYCDVDGRFILSEYVAPSAAVTTGRYRDDQLSIIARDTSSEIDYYKTPNVFIAICDNPDMEESFIGVWINDNPASMFSTIQRGRLITSEIYRPDAIASQELIDKYIKRYAIEATNNRYEQIAFTTALNPLHERAEVLEISHPDIVGTVTESNWTMPLKYDGQMKHEVRRVVIMG